MATPVYSTVSDLPQLTRSTNATSRSASHHLPHALVLLTLGCFFHNAQAADYVSWLVVRYEDQAVKTFIQGPYSSKSLCDKLNQTTWDNVLTACGSCKAEYKFCIASDQVREAYAKALRKERAAFPYVVATPKGRIVISGVPTATAVAECERLAQQFRSNGYAESQCILP